MNNPYDSDFGDLATNFFETQSPVENISTSEKETYHSQFKQSKLRHLLILQDRDGERIIRLDAETYSIGRHNANSIVISDQAISRHHALLLRIPESQSGNFFFRIIDGNLQGKRSHNGIWINGQRIYSHDLQDQDVLTFTSDVQARYHQVYEDVEVPQEKPDSSITHLKSFTQLTDADLETAQKHLGEAALVRLSSMPEMMPNPILEMNLDGEITYLNPAATSAFPNLRKEKNHPLKVGLSIDFLNDPNKYYLREVEVGDYLYEQSIHCIPQSQLIRCYLTDITQRKRMEEILRKSEERYAAAARGANDGLWDWDLIHHSIYFSPRWKAMVGYEDHEIDSKSETWFNLVHKEDYSRLQDELDQHLNGYTPHFECEYRLQHKNGQYRWFRSRGMASYDEENQPYRIAGSQTDITEYRLAREQLLHDAHYDSLTGIPNRTLLMDRINQVIKKCKRRQERYFGVLFLDLDRFKVINDSLGHLFGDKLLVEVAQRLSKCVREEDTVARLGGDEFVILLEDIQDAKAAITTAERIHKALKTVIRLEGEDVFSSASIGITLGNHQDTCAEDVLRNADAAMYKAKREGKDRHEIFSGNLHSQAVALLHLENDLRRAVEHDEFLLNYQPIIDLESHTITGFEALIRWNHPTKGLVSPADFIPLAEDTGLIVPMGWWVLREACSKLQGWQNQFSSASPLSMSVNIASSQFSQPGFVRNLRALLEEIPIARDSLKLEITEGVIMRNPDVVAQKLNQLKALGIKLSIDDFGTGYSSLSYLQTFPVDTLKVDRSFVMRMDQSESREIVKTIIMLAHNLNLDVIAEGIETLDQTQLLKEMNCESGQGFYYSRPIDTESVDQLLKDQNLKSIYSMTTDDDS